MINSCDSPSEITPLAPSCGWNHSLIFQACKCSALHNQWPLFHTQQKICASSALWFQDACHVLLWDMSMLIRRVVTTLVSWLYISGMSFTFLSAHSSVSPSCLQCSKDSTLLTISRIRLIFLCTFYMKCSFYYLLLYFLNSFTYLLFVRLLKSSCF